MAFGGFGVNDISIAKVYDPNVSAKISCVILVIISPRMAEAKQRRCFAHSAWAKPRTGSPLRTEIERSAKDSDIRIYRVPILNVRLFAKRRDSHKRQVQPPCFIRVLWHQFLPQNSLRKEFENSYLRVFIAPEFHHGVHRHRPMFR